MLPRSDRTRQFLPFLATWSQIAIVREADLWPEDLEHGLTEGQAAQDVDEEVDGVYRPYCAPASASTDPQSTAADVFIESVDWLVKHGNQNRSP